MENLKCERGAVMITTIFMVLMLVAMLYMLIGIGTTLMQREGMQDAADAAAYSSAIFNARGMNLIVFINLLMAALVSVLVALRLAQTFLVVISVALAAMAWGSFGATGPLAAKCLQESVQMEKRFKDAKRVIEPILEGLHTTQEAVSVVVPWVAMTDGMTEAARYHEPAKGAFAIPGSTSLPVEADEFEVLCGQASRFIVDLAFAPFPKEMRGLKHLVGDAAEEMGKATSKFLCGDGSGKPPVHEQRVDRVLPRHPDEAKCGADESEPACQRISAEMMASEPGNRGQCQEDCGYQGPYESRARAARVACEPTPTFWPRDFVWQERDVEARFTFDGVVWVEASRSAITSLVRSKTPPCGVRGTVNDHEYNRDSGPPSAQEPTPLCRQEITALKERPAPGTTIDVAFREVARVFSCVVTETKSHDLAGKDDALGGGGSEDKSPHRVEEGVDLGDEALQIRAIAFGERPGPGEAAKKGVLLADVSEQSADDRWAAAAPGGEGVGGKVVDLASQVGRLSVAQAEFYFDHKGDVPRSEWMWDMKWTARLKHFRLPSAEDRSKQDKRKSRNAGAVQSRVAQFGGLDPNKPTETSCQEQGGNHCNASTQALSLFDSVVRH